MQCQRQLALDLFAAVCSGLSWLSFGRLHFRIVVKHLFSMQYLIATVDLYQKIFSESCCMVSWPVLLMHLLAASMPSPAMNTGTKAISVNIFSRLSRSFSLSVHPWRPSMILDLNCGPLAAAGCCCCCMLAFLVGSRGMGTMQ